MISAPTTSTSYARRLLAVWLVALLAFTLYPLGFLHARTVPREWVWTAVQPDGWLELIANVVFFVPLGVLARSARMPAWLALAIGVALSFGIESSQAWIRWRFPTYTDWVANTGGVLIGLAISGPLMQRRRRLLTPSACVFLFMAGLVFSLAIARTEIRFLRFGWAFTFGLAALGAVLARGFTGPWRAIGIASLGAFAVAVVQPELPGPTTIATILIGAALGVWPAFGQADRARASATRA